MSQSGFSVKLLMVRETNSMVGYHSIAKGHLIQLGVLADPGQHPGGG